MKGYSVLLVSSIIFLFVAIMHFLRLLFRVKVTIGETTIPSWVSVVGVIVPLLMAMWILCTLAF